MLNHPISAPKVPNTVLGASATKTVFRSMQGIKNSYIRDYQQALTKSDKNATNFEVKKSLNQQKIENTHKLLQQPVLTERDKTKVLANHQGLVLKHAAFYH
jgi:hypothetical protein